MGKARSAVCCEYGAGRVTRMSKRLGFMVKTVSVEQAIQLGSVSRSMMLRDVSNEER